MTHEKGKLYISTRGGVTLCGACYRGGAKPELTFNVRERPGRALKPGQGLKFLKINKFSTDETALYFSEFKDLKHPF